jgi:hypothetical protein
MTLRYATSDPRPSNKPQHRGYYYFYFNKKLENGGECAALVPESIHNIIRKDFPFDDSILKYDPTLEASILQLDFDAPQAANPSLPPREEGWSDPDHLTAQGAADPAAMNAVAQHHAVIPNRGVRPVTVRKRNAAARAAEHNIDIDLLMLIEQASRAFNITCKLIGTAEKPRPMEAQKIVVTCMIPWLKERGVALSEEDEKAMYYS